MRIATNKSACITNTDSGVHRSGSLFIDVNVYANTIMIGPIYKNDIIDVRFPIIIDLRSKHFMMISTTRAIIDVIKNAKGK